MPEFVPPVTVPPFPPVVVPPDPPVLVPPAPPSEFPPAAPEPPAPAVPPLPPSPPSPPVPPPEIPPLPPEPRATTLSVPLYDSLPLSPELVELLVPVLVVVVLPSQPGRRIVVASRLTAPLRENSRPVTSAPLRAVMPLRPKIVPSTVALLPASQYTLHAFAPLVSFTMAPSAVVSVESVLKRNVAFSSPPASSVTVPETVTAPESPYTPEVSVPETVEISFVTVAEATVSSAWFMSVRARVRASPEVEIVPLTWLLRPVTALPPTSPVIADVPVPVTEPLASTANGAAVSRATTVVWAAARCTSPTPTSRAVAHPATRTAAAPQRTAVRGIRTDPMDIDTARSPRGGTVPGTGRSRRRTTRRTRG